MPDHFRAFAKASGNADWDASVTAVYDLITKMQTMFAPTTGLVSDFIKDTNKNPSPVGVMEADALPMEQLTTDYDYNACRVPVRLGTDLAVSGEPPARAALAHPNAFLTTQTAGHPSMSHSRYTLAR